MFQLAIILRESPRRLAVLRRIVFWLSVVLFFRVLCSILIEYRNYFPANFDSNFLYGREAFFNGGYRIAFYVHIISGPVALLLAAWLMFSGKRKALRHWHRRMGKLLAAIVLLVMLPSGLVMATRALSGPIAGASFFFLSIVLAFCVVMASWHAKERRFVIHQRWATRSFILLCSPMLLRLMTGTTIYFQFETEWTYRFAVWGSWSIPLIAYESRRFRRWRQYRFNTKGIIMKQNSKRGGFTIVELLVVIAIIAILLGMLMPATRTVREASRRTQCMNNLRQIALATVNYESTHMKFPSRIGLYGYRDIGSGDRYSGFVAIMPFLESNNLFEQITKPSTIDGVDYPACPPFYGSDAPHWKRTMPLFLCPSVATEEFEYMPIHYGMSIGDRARNIANPDALRGGFNGTIRIGFDDMTDGSSNVIAFGEICSRAGAAEFPFAVNQPESVLDDPSKCFSLTDDEKDWEYRAGIQLSPIGRGGHWADGRAGVATFNTILAPKSPSAAVKGSVGVDGIYSASGPHPGTINVVLFDGSTHAIGTEINAGDSSMPTPTEDEMAAGAASPYGTWGALGVINDGQVVDFGDF